ncbi:MAG TPA: SDR family oxidoreductase [Candidatus Hydrogenedens sp.]|nr:SDR family oxidoreductase [Candidatus Hydrogenedens sp.]HOK10315.1 SDR family oxidoreductase [Candidatus Hydrogenedens sp.]
MILITGGAGYIGAVAVRELLNHGFAVRVIDKFLFGSEGLEDVANRIECIQGDLNNFDPAWLEDINGVIHLAGLSNDPMAEFNPEANKKLNTEATAILGEHCKRKGIKRFIFASSCSIYDRGLLAEDIIQDEETAVEPRAAYAVSKYQAEQELSKLAGPDFCPTMLRQGTVYGWSPRMRYDLVVNTFVKSAFDKGMLTVHCGGEMWRPLIDVTDIARAYVACLQADLNIVANQIFNLSYKNYRILELAHWVRKVFREFGKNIEIEVEYGSTRGRSYRISTKKTEHILGFRPLVSVEESIRNMVNKIQSGINADFNNPKYYNIQWIELLCQAESIIRKTGSII